MEKELKKYKTATWVFALIAVVLAVLLLMTNNRTTVSGLEEATATLQKCSDDLSAWRAVNPDPAKATALAQEELTNILKACAGDTGATTDEALPQ